MSFIWGVIVGIRIACWAADAIAAAEARGPDVASHRPGEEAPPDERDDAR